MSALRLAEHIARCLDEDKLEYAVGGALALTVHALPRDTADVDISIFAREDELPRVFDALERAGVMLDREDATRSQARIGMWLAAMAPAGDPRHALLDDLARRFLGT